MLDHRVQGTVLGIGRTAEGHAHHPRWPDVLSQFLHQARFADAGLTAEQHHLSVPFGGLLPAPPQ
jgi:hypothetical protein